MYKLSVHLISDHIPEKRSMTLVENTRSHGSVRRASNIKPYYYRWQCQYCTDFQSQVIFAEQFTWIESSVGNIPVACCSTGT